MRVICRTLSQRIVTGGVDDVVAHLMMPEGTVLHRVWLNQHIIGSEETGIHKANIFFSAGFVVPVPEPDSALSIDTLWDNIVPKDSALSVGSEDRDTETLDASGLYEMGLVNPSEIIDGGTQLRRFFKRKSFMTAVTSKLLVPASTVAAFVWFPHDNYKVEMAPKIRASVPSMAMIGSGTPLLTSTTSTVPTSPTSQEWSTIRFIEEALRNAFIHLLNFVESGAESPYDTIAAIIADVLEPTVHEETAGAFESGTTAVFTEATWDFSVEGTFEQQTLNSEI